MAYDPHGKHSPYQHKTLNKTRRQIPRSKGSARQRLERRRARVSAKHYDTHNPIPTLPTFTPPPTPPRPVTPPPWSAAYETSVAGINRDYGNQTAQLDEQQAAVANQYGFDDASNPYNRAALLEQSYKQRQAKSLNSYAASGQLYSGALQNARQGNLQAFGQQFHGLRSEYEQDLQKLADARLKAAQGRDEGLASAEAERLQAALSERPDGSEAPEAPPPPVDPNVALLKRLKEVHAKARSSTGKKRARLSRYEAKIRSNIK